MALASTGPGRVARSVRPGSGSRKPLVKIRDETDYFPHQLEGIRQMARMTSFLLADEMGLGKTLQALTVAAIDYERGFARRTLIVSPASLKWNWAAEMDLHTNFSYLVLDGLPKARGEQLAEFERNGIDVLVVNYEQVKTHLGDLNRLGFNIAIYDEAHYIKNHKAARTKASLGLRADRHFLLTGSPLLNQVNDLWALLHRIDPNGFPKFWSFMNRYAVYGGYKDKQVVGVKNQAELTERLRSVMVRREKKDVLDLPDKQVISVTVELHPEQRKLYRQAADELKIEMPGLATPMEIENALTRFLRLKQICGTTAAIEGFPDHSYKLDRAVEMVEEITASGELVVVFTQFRAVLAAMKHRLDTRGIGSFQLHGDVPMRHRQEVVRAWSDFKQPRDAPRTANNPGIAMLAMLQVAGVGLNMTAASKCIRLDKLFAPKLNEQAEDRLHRIGASATQPVQIYDLICRNTIESRVEAILRRKSKLFGSLVVESEWKRALWAALTDEEEAA